MLEFRHACLFHDSRVVKGPCGPAGARPWGARTRQPTENSVALYVGTVSRLAAASRRRVTSDDWRSCALRGGGKESRTPDLLLAKQALYQLSYTPR